eukprot:121459_1
MFPSRLTGILRDRLTDHGSVDVQESTKKRKQTQQSKKKNAERREVLSQKLLTWKTLTSHTVLSLKQQRSLKRTFNLFMESVEAVVGDGLATGINVAAYSIFRILVNPKGNTQEVKSILEKNFGIVDDSLFNKIQSQAITLFDWHCSTKGTLFPKIYHPDRPSNSVQNGGKRPKRRTEFGTELDFTPPSQCSNEIFRPSEDGEVGVLVNDEEFVEVVPTVSAPQKFTAQWLLDKCEFFVTYIDGVPLQDASQLTMEVIEILQSSRREADIQSALFDTLGPTSFELIADILPNRHKICKATEGFLEIGSAPAPVYPTTSAPSITQLVTVKSSKQIKEEKFRQKQKRRNARKMAKHRDTSGAVPDSPIARSTSAQARLQAAGDRLGVPKAKYDGGKIGQEKLRLPPGTKRTSFEGYEEVYIPAPTPVNIDEDELVQISSFEPFAQSAFEGIERLNRIQSKSFEAAYRTSENLLVCAPTGAGKTNIAMMTVLRALQMSMEDGVMQNASSFKIIYVAPMKALAQEIVSKFSKRLKSLGISCRELTGDMQMTKREISETHMIVTTPEKWDVVTRKVDDLVKSVRLLILDEIHLLNEDRGPVLESLIARTQKLVETAQQTIRVVGLSATLPNYADVAQFLKVNLESGLLYFDQSYRPVPLTQYFIGVSEKNPIRERNRMNEVCYKHMVRALSEGFQVMVFVHSRKETAKIARDLSERLGRCDLSHLTVSPDVMGTPEYGRSMTRLQKSRNKELKELVESGFGMHNAGMLRVDRTLVERLFADGHVKVLCCTATLAWGVNLPAHTVIIKGTELYNAQKGGFVDLGALDVMQIFGRAGRPQYESTGEGIIITSHGSLNRYLSLLTNQIPIESQFIGSLENNLNAEVVLGTVTNLQEAIDWLAYTYLYIRMLRNPMHYGIKYEEANDDPHLVVRRQALIYDAAQKLKRCRMVRYENNNFYPTGVGRVASHYYIHYESMETFLTALDRSEGVMTNEEVIHLLCQANEFDQIKVRDEELNELDQMKRRCFVRPMGAVENTHGKTNVLIQAFISNAPIRSFTLISDMMYITQSVGRICRALFEICINKNYPGIAERFLSFTKMFDKRMWEGQHPLRQFPQMKQEILFKLEDRKLSLRRILEEDVRSIGTLIRNQKAASDVLRFARQIPKLSVDATVQPITSTVLRIKLVLIPEFDWNVRVHGSLENFWIWVEDNSDEQSVHYKEMFSLKHKAYASEEDITLEFSIPIQRDNRPTQYIIRVISDRWLGSDTTTALSFEHLILPEEKPPQTELMSLHPLPVKALKNKRFESLYSFEYFNPIQTQVFHIAYHTDKNILLGSPTGSGKTVCAEIAMFRIFNTDSRLKVVYVAPLKALARERYRDWRGSMQKKLGIRVVMLTGDHTPNVHELNAAQVLITTPEKWDGISRNWKNRSYVRQVALVVIDEIHLLGQDRGPVLEVIVSRLRYISEHTSTPTRIVGLSTALANAHDLGNWLGISDVGVYNFHHSLRPVPITVHVAGYPGKHYCPRMNSMNKPAYQAIMNYSPSKPVLVFVSSRRQTRLTALDLITYSNTDGNPYKWVRMEHSDLEKVLRRVKDPNLKNTLEFGVGLHHAGLLDSDRKIVEELFFSNLIQVLVCTSTLAWGVNFPAHLVVIKGTEYYDPKAGRYVDFPLTDVLQMMGRAGRPQFDDTAVACILVHEPKKNFYKQFLHEPFPVESSLQDCLHNHINAEVVSGIIQNIKDGVEYITWTFFFRRLLRNPSYYNLDSLDETTEFVTQMIEETVMDLEEGGCLEYNQLTKSVTPTTLGRIASFYYLSYTTVGLFHHGLRERMEPVDLLKLLCCAAEYDELPVRHNEEKYNEQLDTEMRWPCGPMAMDAPSTKAFLLFQAHLQRVAFPVADYATDLRSVLDQAIRVLQAMVDIGADKGSFETTRNILILLQMVIQARCHDDSTLLNLPHITQKECDILWTKDITVLPQLREMSNRDLGSALSEVGLNRKQIGDVSAVLSLFPVITMSFRPAKFRTSPAQSVTLNATVRADRAPPPGKSAHAPKWPKPRQPGWFMILANQTTDSLVALKRVKATRRGQSHRLNFTVPERPGKYTFCLCLVSDSYLGLDQEYDVEIEVADSAEISS